MVASFAIGETVPLILEATQDGTPVDFSDPEAAYTFLVKVKPPGLSTITIDNDDISISEDGLTVTAKYTPSVVGQHYYRFAVTDADGTTFGSDFFQVEETPFD